MRRRSSDSLLKRQRRVCVGTGVSKSFSPKLEINGLGQEGIRRFARSSTLINNHSDGLVLQFAIKKSQPESFSNHGPDSNPTWDAKPIPKSFLESPSNLSPAQMFCATTMPPRFPRCLAATASASGRLPIRPGSLGRLASSAYCGLALTLYGGLGRRGGLFML